MADTKLSALTELTAMPASTDEFYLNDGGTSKRITHPNMMQSEHGGIYLFGHSTGQTLNASAGTFDIMTGWNSAEGFNGLSSTGVTPAKASNKITIVETGIYQVNLSVSFGGTNSALMDFRVYLNAVAQDQVSFRRKLGTGGDIGRAACTGFIDVTTASWDIDVRVAADGSSNTMTPYSGTLAILRVGST